MRAGGGGARCACVLRLLRRLHAARRQPADDRRSQPVHETTWGVSTSHVTSADDRTVTSFSFLPSRKVDRWPRQSSGIVWGAEVGEHVLAMYWEWRKVIAGKKERDEQQGSPLTGSLVHCLRLSIIPLPLVVL